MLCDTNGGTLPNEIEEIVRDVAKVVPGSHLGIHTHNDTENAVANTLAAIRAGARHIQGTLNGLGERCGNANLCSLLPTLLLKEEYASRFETGVSLEQLTHLKKISVTLDELLNRRGNRHAPYVGESAFATKAGIHASAVLKDPKTYEHVPPEAVGNVRRVLVSDQAGRSNILAELERLGVSVAKDDPRVGRMLDEVKERESLGFAYEAADASFELLARRMLGEVPRLLRGRAVQRQRRAAAQCAGRTRVGVRSHREGARRRRRAHLGGRRQRPRQRARSRAAQGSWPLPVHDRGSGACSIIACASSTAERMR